MILLEVPAQKLAILAAANRLQCERVLRKEGQHLRDQQLLAALLRRGHHPFRLSARQRDRFFDQHMFCRPFAAIVTGSGEAGAANN